MKVNKKIIGVQILKKDSTLPEIPKDFFSFEVLSQRAAHKWLKGRQDRKEWKIVPVLENDIEEPTFVKSSEIELYELL